MSRFLFAESATLLNEGKNLRVNVGCGSSPTPGWVNLDGSFSVKWARTPLVLPALRTIGLISSRNLEFGQYAKQNDVGYGDVTGRLPLADESCGVLYSCHMLEHILPKDVGGVLAEMKRCLVPGGILRVAVPDLRRMAEAYVASGDCDRFMEASMLGHVWGAMGSFGGRMRVALSGSPSSHKWMYDGQSLVKLLESQGFRDSRELADGETMIDDPGDLNLAERSPESVFVEARK